MSEKKYPRIGIGVLIKNEKEEVLIGQRISSHGTGEWSFPGGHLEFGESIFECAAREVMEETGLVTKTFKLISLADELRYLVSDDKHYVNIGVLAKYENGDPINLEPEKCSGWQWFSLDNLPSPLFEGTELVINNYKERQFN